MRIAIPVLLAFGLSMSGLYLSAAETNKNLLATNADLLLMNAELVKHPVHDAEITVWTRKDGKLLVVVNGQFGHLVSNPCANQGAL